MQSIQIKVFGKVQGVWYRKSTQQKAQELGLKGTVQNLDDGTVWIEAEGQLAQLSALQKWCQEGPPLADVKRIEVHASTWKGFDDFKVLR